MTFFRTFAIALTALILIPSGAHLFELPGKIGLDRDAYFTVQQIYAGWSLFGAPIFAAILVNIVLYFAERRHHAATAHWALIAASLIVISLGVFFTWIFPANQATENWTMQPDNWEALRSNWEYGHAANAILVGACSGHADHGECET
jgi:membrane protease YdiL (CAAX protease family)